MVFYRQLSGIRCNNLIDTAVVLVRLITKELFDLGYTERSAE